MNKVMKLVCVVGVAGLLLAACGSSSSKSDSNKTVTTTAVKVTTTTTTVDPNAPTMKVTPDTGLTEGQTVQVTGAKFKPNATLGINECADKGADTQSGDCDLAHLVPATSDAQGNVTGSKAVTKGPFGGNNIVCSSTQPCLLSIAELTANGQNASAGITFAG
jgi:Neocarzinostatin family